VLQSRSKKARALLALLAVAPGAGAKDGIGNTTLMERNAESVRVQRPAPERRPACARALAPRRKVFARRIRTTVNVSLTRWALHALDLAVPIHLTGR